MSRPKRPNAIKIYEGPSVIQPDTTVMVVVTGLKQSTSNEKTAQGHSPTPCSQDGGG